MAKCKWCSRSGLFLITDKDGLCNNCVETIGNVAINKLNILQMNEKVIERTENIDKIISKSELNLEILSDFIKYENKGIRIFSLPIKEAIPGTCKETDDRIRMITNRHYSRIYYNAGQIETKKAKAELIQEYKIEIDKVISYLDRRKIKNDNLKKKLLEQYNTLLNSFVK